MNDYQVLASATTLLAAGWCQNTLQKTEYPSQAVSYCMQGAVCEAGGFCYTPEQISVHSGNVDDYKRLLGIVRSALPEGEEHITTFNDRPDTTQADVLAVMGKALEAVRLGGGTGTGGDPQPDKELVSV